jgi:excisionase family DNA binding protein
MKTFNYKEAANFLKIKPGTLRNWVSQGKIKPHRTGKHVLFFREELEAWIKSQPVETRFNASHSRVNASLKNPANPQKSKTKPSAPWNKNFTVDISPEQVDPYALLKNLPGPDQTLSPDELRELARYLVDTANLCEKKECRGIQNFKVIKENENFKSSVCLIPFDLARDINKLAKADAKLSGKSPQSNEKLIENLLRKGLKQQLPLLNKKLKKQGKRRINLKSIK